MICGEFGERGEWIFEIELVSNQGEVLAVDAIFDSGFTAGYLAINSQDLSALGWTLLQANVELITARGLGRFDIYRGEVIIDERSYIISVYAGLEIPDVLMGVKWMQLSQLTINQRENLLTLEMLD